VDGEWCGEGVWLRSRGFEGVLVWSRESRGVKGGGGGGG